MRILSHFGHFPATKHSLWNDARQPEKKACDWPGVSTNSAVLVIKTWKIRELHVYFKLNIQEGTNEEGCKNVKSDDEN